MKRKLSIVSDEEVPCKVTRRHARSEWIITAVTLPYLDVLTRHVLHYSRKQLGRILPFGDQLKTKTTEHVTHRLPSSPSNRTLVCSDAAWGLTPTTLFMASSLSDSLLLSSISLRSSFLRTEDGGELVTHHARHQQLDQRWSESAALTPPAPQTPSWAPNGTLTMRPVKEREGPASRVSSSRPRRLAG